MNHGKIQNLGTELASFLEKNQTKIRKIEFWHVWERQVWKKLWLLKIIVTLSNPNLPCFIWVIRFLEIFIIIFEYQTKTQKSSNTIKMKITIAIVMISTIQFAAIKSVSTIDDSASNDIHEIGLRSFRPIRWQLSGNDWSNSKNILTAKMFSTLTWWLFSTSSCKMKSRIFSTFLSWWSIANLKLMKLRLPTTKSIINGKKRTKKYYFWFYSWQLFWRTTCAWSFEVQKSFRLIELFDYPSSVSFFVLHFLPSIFFY